MFDLSTIRAKLTAAFGALTLLVVLIALLALQSLSAANQRFDRYVHGVNARAALAAQVRAAVDRRAIAARNLVLVTDPAHLAAEKAIVGAAHADVQKHLSALNKEMAEASDASDAARSLVGEITRVESAYGPVALAIVDLALSDRKPESIAKMNKECRPLLEALVDASQKYADLTQARAKEMIRHAEEEYALQRLILLAVCVAGFVAAVVAGVLIARSLGRALGAEPAELGVIAKRIADGDLRRLEVRAVPGSVLASLVVMQEGLAKIVGQVRGASNSIATGSAQIASGNADLSERTEQQASALQQTAATMAELDVTVRNNAGNASQASDLARGASAVAAQGGSVVAEVVATMKDINESSTRIAAIISVIDGIAFQTNILALNAAVEAARAGEQGRGFAVVAGEVRTLAQRSAEAAKEIKTLISASVDRVNTGSALVDRAGRTMSEIVSAIDRVTHVVGEISAASNEQSAGVSQVGEAVTQMDRATQSNAALVEESAAAAESLRQQAAQLVQAVAAFKLAESAC